MFFSLVFISGPDIYNIASLSLRPPLPLCNSPPPPPRLCPPSLWGLPVVGVGEGPGIGEDTQGGNSTSHVVPHHA